MPREILKGYVPTPQVFEKDCRTAMYVKGKNIVSKLVRLGLNSVTVTH